MSYVPGHSHDLFLSYARDEAEWVEAFRAGIEKRLYIMLGRKVEFWQDTQDLLVGENWVRNIRAVIESAAAFIAVCSPLYFRPGSYCLKESGMAERFRQNELFLKIMKTPSFDGEHNAFYREIHRIDFFAKDLSEFFPGSREFEQRLLQSAEAIAQKLRKLRNSKVAVYVAQTEAGMNADRAQLENQLEATGYKVTVTDPAFAGSRLAPEVQAAELSVFLLGGAWDGYVADQIQAAFEAGKPAVFWIHPARAAKPEEQQDKLIQAIRAGEGIPAGSQILGGSNVRAVIGQLQEILKPKPEFASLAATEASKGKVCMIHDPGEAPSAKRVAGMIRDRRFDVFEPDGNQPGGILQALPRLIADVDGLLLYRGNAPQPDNWLQQSFPQVEFADRVYRAGREALRARTCLLANPSPFDQTPGVQVIPCPGEPTPEMLQPFFDRMTQGRFAHAGA